MDSGDCKDLYKRLRRLYQSSKGAESEFIRQFESTARCDKTGKDLSLLRNSYKFFFNEKMGNNNAYDNLLNKKSDDLDTNYMAEFTLLHHKSLTKKAFGDDALHIRYDGSPYLPMMIGGSVLYTSFSLSTKLCREIIIRESLIIKGVVSDCAETWSSRSSLRH